MLTGWGPGGQTPTGQTLKAHPKDDRSMFRSQKTPLTVLRYSLKHFLKKAEEDWRQMLYYFFLLVYTFGSDAITNKPFPC